MARAIWSGNISFGLVNIPVELFRAERRTDLHFQLVDSRNRARVRYERINEETGEEVPWNAIVKAFEFHEGNYVLLTDEDLKEVAVKATKTIEIEGFVDRDDIDVMYYDKPYFLVPGKKGDKGYVLLREALKRTNRVGIAKVVIRTREYLCGLMNHGNALLLMILRFHQEVLEEEEFEIPSGKPESYRISAKEIDLAEQLLESMTRPWKPDEFVDDYRAALMKWIESKARHGETGPVKGHETESDSEPTIINLMDVLKKSVEQNRKAKPAAAKRKAPSPIRRPAKRKRA